MVSWIFSPRLYHMSLILKPMVFLMSPYLRFRPGSHQDTDGR